MVVYIYMEINVFLPVNNRPVVGGAEVLLQHGV